MGVSPSVQVTRDLGDETESITRDDLAVGRRTMVSGVVGRYSIEREIGAGGMGEVFAAFDPQLERSVALKLVRPRAERAEVAGARLRREAQALARLSHPNVVPVFDAGVHGDRIFIAMELVDGKTLSQWNRDTSPSWSQLLSMLIQAGRGLTAAHRAGVIHRDFKPANVMVGADGRARVLDFGLARDAMSDGLDPDGTPTRGSFDGFGLGPVLTEVGSVMGTPTYMSPEQFLGEDIDARSDQFSFCVAAYRLLYGAPPFVGKGVEEIRRSVLNGRLEPPPHSSSVPGWIWTALRRGMTTNPKERFADMPALLEVLERGTHRRRRIFMASGLALALGLGGSLAFGGLASEDACSVLEARADAMWSESRQTDVYRAFDATALPYAAAAWKEVDERLVDYVQDWNDQRQQACRAIVRGNSGAPSDLDGWITCLDRQLARADAVVQTFETGDPEVVRNAPQAVLHLPVLEQCRRAEFEPMPDLPEPQVAAQVAALEEQLDAIEATMLMRHGVSVLAEAQAIADEASSLGYGPLIADSQHVLGRAHQRDRQFPEAHAAYEAAIQASAEIGDIRREVLAQLRLASLQSSNMVDQEGALRQLRAAEALLVRVGSPPLLTARFEEVRGHTLIDAGKLDEAYEQLRALLDRPGDHEGMELVMASARSGLAVTLTRQGRYEESVELLAEELAVLERRLGPDHPRVARALTNRGNSLNHLGRLDEAEASLTRGIDILTRAGGPKAEGLDTLLHNLGILHHERGQPEQALDALRRSIELTVERRGSDHPSLAWARNDLGAMLFDHDDPVEAIAHLEESVRVFEVNQGDDSAGLIYPLGTLIRAYRDAKRPRDAISQVDRALELLERPSVEPLGAGMLRFAVAQALWDGGAERERALALAEEAKAEMARSERDTAGEVELVESWIEEQRGSSLGVVTEL